MISQEMIDAIRRVEDEQAGRILTREQDHWLSQNPLKAMAVLRAAWDAQQVKAAIDERMYESEDAFLDACAEAKALYDELRVAVAALGEPPKQSRLY